MAANSTHNEAPMIRSVRDLTPELRDDIEALLDDGVMPTDVAEELEVPHRIVKAVRRTQKRIIQRSESPTNVTAAAPASMSLPNASSPVAAAIQSNIQNSLLQAQLDELEDQNHHRKEMRRLERQRAQQDLRRERLEMREEYGDQVDEDEEEPADINTDPLTYDFDRDPLGAAMNLFTKLKSMKESGVRSTDPVDAVIVNSTLKENDAVPSVPTTPDVTKPLTREQILAELSVATPDQMKKLQSLSNDFIAKVLKQQYPGIIETNINLAINEIKNYGR